MVDLNSMFLFINVKTLPRPTELETFILLFMDIITLIINFNSHLPIESQRIAIGCEGEKSFYRLV